MELYNGRLDKTPGAIALRHRWYVREKMSMQTYLDRRTFMSKTMHL
jgi:SPX domain protein involved in polyphosphate accumulation